MSQLALGAAVFWLPFMPLFAMFFIYKCADLLCYKKLRLISSVKNFVLFDLLIVLASHILSPFLWFGFLVAYSLLFHVDPKPLEEVLGIAATLVSTIVPLIIMHCKERKKMNCCLGKPAFHKRIFWVNAILMCFVDALYAHFYLAALAAKSGIFFSSEWLDLSKCLITVIVFLLIKIVFVIVFTRANSKKLKALPEEALQTEKI